MDATTKQVTRLVAWGINAVFAYVLLEMYFKQKLKYYLNTDIFGGVVLVAGILLLFMVMMKPLVWSLQKAGIMTPPSDPGCCHHDHGAGHDHEHHDHSHDAALWKLIILTFPLMMLMAGFVPQQLSAQAIMNKMSQQQKLAAEMVIASLPPGRTVENAKITTTTMLELTLAARQDRLRAHWESTESPILARVVGQPMRTNAPNRYQLTRLKMNCCANDAVPLMVVVVGKPQSDWQPNDWVEVVGPVAYQQDPTGGYTAVIYEIEAKKLSAPPSEIMLK